MASLHLVATGACALVAATAFAVAAVTFARRPVSAANRAAAVAFAAWWGLLATQALTDAGRTLLGLASDPDVGLFSALVRLKIVAAGAAVGLMSYYLLHLWGAPRALRAACAPLAVLHGVLFLFLFERRLPADVVVGTWTTQLVLSGPPLLNAYAQMLGTSLFFLPPLVFALAYLAFGFRLRDRAGRTRAFVVAIALLVFHTASILQFDPDRSDTGIVPLLSLANVAAAALVLFAYSPPAWAARRWGLRRAAPGEVEEPSPAS